RRLDAGGGATALARAALPRGVALTRRLRRHALRHEPSLLCGPDQDPAGHLRGARIHWPPAAGRHAELAAAERPGMGGSGGGRHRAALALRRYAPGTRSGGRGAGAWRRLDEPRTAECYKPQGAISTTVVTVSLMRIRG